MRLSKAIGGVAWVIGIVMLFIEPGVATAILVGAAVITLWTRAAQRRRWDELRATKPKSFMGIAPGLATLADIESRLDSGEITLSEAEARLEVLKGGTAAEDQLTAIERLMAPRRETGGESPSMRESGDDDAEP